ncbi:hypothetical protein JCM2811A_09070 [Methylorubrum rhodinum]
MVASMRASPQRRQDARVRRAEKWPRIDSADGIGGAPEASHRVTHEAPILRTKASSR